MIFIIIICRICDKNKNNTFCTFELSKTISNFICYWNVYKDIKTFNKTIQQFYTEVCQIKVKIPSINKLFNVNNR